jgi:hypothetical protein
MRAGGASAQILAAWVFLSEYEHLAAVLKRFIRKPGREN